ncbi:MAG: GNAT family N-acetyltransferase [Taibaiella sp.]|nr:GNAT family N-acetyltransferase [Taibaiella sp.]
MNHIEIAQVNMTHVGLLQKIAIQTFWETFSDVNSDENMKKYLEDRFSVEKLSAELGDENAKFYFARSGHNVIGYLKLNTGQSQTEIKKANTVEIERIYVLKDFHGKKAGQLLYGKALEIARQLNADYIWLGVWEQNPRAIRFYTKNGFEAFDRHIFILGDDRQTDILMKKVLEKETDI